MATTVIDTRPLIKHLEREIVQDYVALHRTGLISPGLGILLVTGDQVLMAATDKVKKAAEDLDIHLRYERVAARKVEDKLLPLLQAMVDDSSISGILLATPTGMEGVDFDRLYAVLPSQKDVTGLHYEHVGRLALGTTYVLPPRVQAVLEIIGEEFEEQLGRGVVIVSSRYDGLSGYYGRCLALHFARHNRQVTLRAPAVTTKAQSTPPRTDPLTAEVKDLALYNPGGELLISIANSLNALTKATVKRGSVVIDAGFNFYLKRIAGDANFPELMPLVRAITTVPGGVDALAPLCALTNMLTLAKRSIQFEVSEEMRGLRARRRL